MWEPQVYRAKDVAASGSNVAWFEWVRRGAPRELDAGELAHFAAAITKLEPRGDHEIACTADLGPRCLVSYAQENEG